MYDVLDEGACLILQAYPGYRLEHIGRLTVFQFMALLKNAGKRSAFMAQLIAGSVRAGVWADEKAFSAFVEAASNGTPKAPPDAADCAQDFGIAVER